MPNKDNQSSGVRNNRYRILKVLAAMILFPFLWLGVTINLFGIAEKLSFLPGISQNGGITSGISAFLLSLILISIVGVGAMITVDGGVSVGSSGDQPQPPSAQTPSEIPVSTKTAPKTESTPIQTTNRTPTPTHTPKGPLEKFDSLFRDEINESWEREDLVDVPILGTDFRENGRGEVVMWVVYWQCDKAIDVKGQRQTISASYADSVAFSNERKPDLLRVYGVAEWEKLDDYTTYITTVEAKRVLNGSISKESYLKTWINRGTDPSHQMNQTAYQIAVNESGQAKADKAFYDDHEEQQGCPGAAESGITTANASD